MTSRSRIRDQDIRAAMEKAAEASADYLVNMIAPEVAELAELAESHIELLMGAALMALSQIRGGELLASGAVFQPKILGDGEPAWLVPQFEVRCGAGRYRLDFALLSSRDLSPLVFVECDGHEFHERTKEQARRDKSRDRDLTITFGVPVLRFTGSEIFRHPAICASQVFSYLDR